MANYTIQVVIPDFDSFTEEEQNGIRIDLQEIFDEYVGEDDTRENLEQLQADIKFYVDTYCRDVDED